MRTLAVETRIVRSWKASVKIAIISKFFLPLNKFANAVYVSSTNKKFLGYTLLIIRRDLFIAAGII
jgi:hypothetical protein